MTTLMTTLQAPNKFRTPGAEKRAEAARVIAGLAEMCVTVGAGGRLPRHTELMRQFGASERNVLRSLEELQRQGRIVRRHGSGTFVTDGQAGIGALRSTNVLGDLSRTVVALTMPDRSIFDRCIEMLYTVTAAADLNLASHFIGPERVSGFDVEALGRPYGFIVFRRDLAPLARQLQDAGNRVVMVGAPLAREAFGVPTVCGNQEHGGYLATKHLVQLGHRRIAFADLSGMLLDHGRWQGHLRATSEANRSGNEVLAQVLHAETIGRWSADPKTVESFFRQPNAPTAVAAWNDNEALHIMATLQRAGLRVPGDVSIIGYDNLSEGERYLPSLTTIDHLINEQVDAAMTMLTSGAPLQANERLIYAPTVIARESTKELVESRQLYLG